MRICGHFPARNVANLLGQIQKIFTQLPLRIHFMLKSIKNNLGLKLFCKLAVKLKYFFCLFPHCQYWSDLAGFLVTEYLRVDSVELQHQPVDQLGVHPLIRAEKRCIILELLITAFSIWSRTIRTCSLTKGKFDINTNWSENQTGRMSGGSVQQKLWLSHAAVMP